MDKKKIAYGFLIAALILAAAYFIVIIVKRKLVIYGQAAIEKKRSDSFHPASFEPVENTEFNEKPTIENPEGYIEMMNNLGDSIPINKLSENLSGDKVSVINGESTIEKVSRSFWDADVDGPQIEGMTAPVDEFEKAAMALQNSKASDLYVDYKSQSADQLSEANI